MLVLVLFLKKILFSNPETKVSVDANNVSLQRILELFQIHKKGGGENFSVLFKILP